VSTSCTLKQARSPMGPLLALQLGCDSELHCHHIRAWGLLPAPLELVSAPLWSGGDLGPPARPLFKSLVLEMAHVRRAVTAGQWVFHPVLFLIHQPLVFPVSWSVLKAQCLFLQPPRQAVPTKAISICVHPERFPVFLGVAVLF
jgi:hypothetical protein